MMPEPMMNVTLRWVGRVKMEAVEPVGHAVDSFHLPRLSRVTVVYAKCYTPVYRSSSAAPNTVHCIRRRSADLGSVDVLSPGADTNKPAEGSTARAHWQSTH